MRNLSGSGLVDIASAMMAAVSPSEASALAVDLESGFFRDDAVSVSGSSASFVEDPGLGSVLLQNDPSFGDPMVIIPAEGRRLTLDYAFTVGGADDRDEFSVVLFDSVTGVSFLAHSFFTQVTGAGSLSFDLGPLVGYTLGLTFALSSLPGDGGLGSTAAISNVAVVAPIPLPGTAALLIAATALLFRRSVAKGGDRA